MQAGQREVQQGITVENRFLHKLGSGIQMKLVAAPYFILFWESLKEAFLQEGDHALTIMFGLKKALMHRQKPYRRRG